MWDWKDYLVLFFEFFIFFYCMGILGSYFIIGLVSALEVIKYKKDRDLTDYTELLKCPLVPSISIIAPAYNESVTIVDNIKSLVSLHYTKLTVIVVNDGSKDDTLQKAIDAYHLKKVDYYYDERIKTKEVRGIYKSENPAYKALIFVDKANGGKADAINVGVNISSSQYFACIDVDCIIEADAFLKMVKPIMREQKRKVVAVGGIVWLTNDSVVQDGKLIQVNTPNSFVARMQVIEYFRAFLLGRTAWSKINGLLLISGAFGLFERETVLEVGGYNHNTVGEDMELVMRMHVYLREKKIKYKVGYVPEPLCWTEAPAGYDILSKQRNRWTRGTIECLMIHKKMLFNPKYGVLGLVSYPYWLFAEWLAPFAEVGGTIFVIVLAILGMVNWKIFFLMLALVYVFAMFISFFSILVQEISYYKYEKNNDIFKLLFTAMIEPFRYHPRTVYWAIKGNYDKFIKNSSGWGEMTRAGFSTPAKK